jgi:hypothetical protein
MVVRSRLGLQMIGMNLIGKSGGRVRQRDFVFDAAPYGRYQSECKEDCGQNLCELMCWMSRPHLKPWALSFSSDRNAAISQVTLSGDYTF